MSMPVTVSITRHVAPEHSDEMLAWIRAGGALAVRFEGFLGTGWVRSGPDSEVWHMLYRFADEESLARWEESSQRRWWLGAAQGLVGESRLERRTGIEGWFDEPTQTDVQDLRPPPPAPPRWKQACVIFLVFFPLSLIVNWLAGAFLTGLFLPARVLVSVLLMTPVMTYLALPWITRRMEWWLHGRPAPWRR
ncbi:antibiotic biosynthesis monooxygenase [Nocardioides donggukensis]|uniref:Antibiotic biosynthesis monooxygenase n=1 Tax=Nocardioides donggukensis TaxID=2774019 RepID=A0A927K177_9ACTN|nr:antibiotic biosynthesis monooxygenase [Nocardioides donggukensis]MBD8868257.1 antibiotic biosynthesis monooxygenase [Nocardioides donggukensis]